MPKGLRLHPQSGQPLFPSHHLDLFGLFLFSLSLYLRSVDALVVVAFKLLTPSCRLKTRYVWLLFASRAMLDDRRFDFWLDSEKTGHRR